METIDGCYKDYAVNTDEQSSIEIHSVYGSACLTIPNENGISQALIKIGSSTNPNVRMKAVMRGKEVEGIYYDLGLIDIENFRRYLTSYNVDKRTKELILGVILLPTANNMEYGKTYPSNETRILERIIRNKFLKVVEKKFKKRSIKISGEFIIIDCNSYKEFLSIVNIMSSIDKEEKKSIEKSVYDRYYSHIRDYSNEIKEKMETNKMLLELSEKSALNSRNTRNLITTVASFVKNLLGNKVKVLG